MPPRSKAAEAAAAVEEEDYTAYADKEPTDLQARFTAWILDKTEYEPSGAKTKQAAFEDGVRMGVALRMKFQASPENQEVLEERRQAREAAEDEEETPAPKAKRKTPARGKAKAAAVEEKPDEEPEEDDTEEEPEESPAPPKRRTRKTATAKAPAKSATTAKPTRRRAKAAAASGDAPF